MYSIFKRGIWSTVGAPSWRGGRKGGSFGPHTDRIQNSLAPGFRREKETDMLSRERDRRWRIRVRGRVVIKEPI